MITILYVEDSPICREPIAAMLRLKGYEVLCAGDGEEALSLLRTCSPQVILLDLGLPKMDGIEVLSHLQHHPGHSRIPVIILSAAADLHRVQKAKEFGVRDYLLKSQFSLEELLTRMSNRLSHATPAPAPSAATPVPQGPQKTSAPPSLSTAPSTTSTSIAPAPPPSPAPATAAAPEAPEPPEPAPAPAATTVSDRLRSLKPIVTREQVLEQVDRCAELKALSPTVAQLLSMTASAECSLDQLSRVIKRDQAIALKVLKVANSVVYNRGERVETVQKALSRIGVAQIRQVVLNISVIDNFTGGLGDQFNSRLFWEHSIGTALIAAAITRYRRHDDRQVDAAFTMGLLHDVARMVFVDQLGEMYKRVLDTAGRLQLPLEQVETRMLLLNHADLMDRVLNSWKFPKAIVEPIALHHLSSGNIRNLSPQMVTEVSTLALANRLAHAMLLGFSGNDAIYPTDEFARILELNPEQIAILERQIPEETTDMKFAMLQSEKSADWPDYRRMVLKQFDRSLRPLYISASPGVDAYRILLSQLATTGGDEKPNIGIVRVTSVEERRAMAELLLAAEQQAGVDPLPLIIISPNGTLKLEPKVLQSRMHRVLPSPFTLSRLADTVNNLLPPEEAGGAAHLHEH